jgi:cyclopropane fatty-acyl-phospholipid synthase-like methyltransferase
MKLLNYLLEQTPIYRIWQAPFAAAKVAPMLAHNDVSQARRVLDIGCGPGINTRLFMRSDYLGVDINAHYIEYAKKKYKHRFEQGDITSCNIDKNNGFDWILANSFFHHIETRAVHYILDRLSSWLTENGHIHILDLIKPDNPSIAQFIANWDRGKYARSLQEWQTIFKQHLDIMIFEPYTVKALGTTLWNMIYCKAKARN